MKCLVTRNKDGDVISVSAALPPGDLEELREMHEIAGTPDHRMEAVTTERARELKKRLSNTW
jgi:hypothetical protein